MQQPSVVKTKTNSNYWPTPQSNSYNRTKYNSDFDLAAAGVLGIVVDEDGH